MSRENVDIVRQALDAFNRHDVEGLVALSSPDAELVTLRAALEGTVYRGQDAFAQAFKDFDESWDDLRFEMQELTEGSDSILAVGTLHGRGRGSGADVEVDLAFVARLRDGLIRSFRTYTDRAEALEAAGLSE